MLRWMKFICLLFAALIYIGHADQHCFRFTACKCRSNAIFCANAIMPNQVLFNGYNDATDIIFYNIGLTSLDINDHYTKLHNLTIEANEIETVKLGDLDAFAELKTLILDNNVVSKLQTSAHTITTSLEHLSLRDNKLTDIGGGLGHFSNLRHLYLSSNQLSFVDFDKLPRSLEVLDLSSNLITSTTTAQAALESFTSLTELKIFDNKIHFFTTDNAPSSLQYLDVRSNPIQSVQLYNHHRFTSLDLYINAQSIHCTCGLIADYVGATQAGTINLRCGGGPGLNSCMTCDPQGVFRNYSFITDDIERLQLQDETDMECLNEIEAIWILMGLGVALFICFPLLIVLCKRRCLHKSDDDAPPSITMAEFKQRRKQVAQSDPQIYVGANGKDPENKRSASETAYKATCSLKRAKAPRTRANTDDTYVAMKSFKERSKKEQLPSIPVADPGVEEDMEEVFYEELNVYNP